MNKNFILLSSIFRGMWLMSAETAQSYMPLIVQLVQGKNVLDQEEAKPTASYVAVAAAGNGLHNYFTSYDEAPEGSAAITRVSGALMKADYCFQPGTASLRNAILEADRHQNVSSHILLIDSPGGQVDGTKALADAIKGLSKPVVAYVDGMAASAAYWIASAADEIVISSETSLIGSIGTMISMKDMREYYEQMGIKVHHIFAEDSSDKNRIQLEALDGNYKPIQEQMLNPTNDIFLNAVQSNRPNVSKKALTGRVFLAADAIKMGLADSIGSFEFALKRAQELISSDQKVNQPQNEMFGNKKFAGLQAAILAITALQQGEAMTDDHVDAVNAELEKLGISGLTLVADSQLEDATATVASLTAEIAAAQETITSLTAERDAAQAQAAEYGAQPGAEHSQLNNGTGDQVEDPSQSLIDSLPHNMALDSNPLFNQKSK